MKLYKFKYRNEIEECEVVKETNKTFVYCEPNNQVTWTALKKDLNAPIGAGSHKIVATSIEKLIEAGVLIVESNIEFHKNQIERLKEEKNNILKLSNK